MYFQVEIQENGRKNMGTQKQTEKKVPLVFLDLKVLTQRQQMGFQTLATNKQGTVYVFTVEKPRRKQ